MNILKKLSVVVFLTLLSSYSTLGEATRVDREFTDLWIGWTYPSLQVLEA